MLLRVPLMVDSPSPLTPMDIARYYMGRLAMRVDAEHFQELCRTATYAIDPAATAYQIVLGFGLTDLDAPEQIVRAGALPNHSTPPRS